MPEQNKRHHYAGAAIGVSGLPAARPAFRRATSAGRGTAWRGAAGRWNLAASKVGVGADMGAYYLRHGEAKERRRGGRVKGEPMSCGLRP